MSRNFAVLLLVASAVVALAACTNGSGSPAHSPTSTSRATSPAAANAAATTYRAQLTAWSRKLSDQVTTLRFADHVNLGAIETATQEAGERAACSGSAAALQLLSSAPHLAAADATGSPAYAQAQQKKRAIDMNVSTLRSDLTQYGNFCRLYLKLLDVSRQGRKVYAQWVKKYEHKGDETFNGQTLTCDYATYCLNADQSKYDASAALFRRAYQYDYTEQGPAPFAGAAWAKLWTAFQQQVATERASVDRYVAALRYYRGKPISLHGSAGNKIDAASKAWVRNVAAAQTRTVAVVKQSGLFPTAYVSRFARAAKHNASAEVYFTSYQMRRLEDQIRQLASAISKQ